MARNLTQLVLELEQLKGVAAQAKVSLDALSKAEAVALSSAGGRFKGTVDQRQEVVRAAGDVSRGNAPTLSFTDKKDLAMAEAAIRKAVEDTVRVYQNMIGKAALDAAKTAGQYTYAVPPTVPYRPLNQQSSYYSPLASAMQSTVTSRMVADKQIADAKKEAAAKEAEILAMRATAASTGVPVDPLVLASKSDATVLLNSQIGHAEGLSGSQRSKLKSIEKTLMLKIGDVKVVNQIMDEVIAQAQLLALEGYIVKGGSISIRPPDKNGNRAITPNFKITDAAGAKLPSEKGERRYVLANGQVVNEIPTNFSGGGAINLQQQMRLAAFNQSGSGSMWQNFGNETKFVEDAVKKTAAELAKLGINAKETKYNMQQLADGSIKVSASLMDGNKVLNTQDFYLEKINGRYEIFTREVNDAKKAAEGLGKSAEITSTQLANLQKNSPEVFNKAGQYGFGAESLKRVNTEGSTGYSRYQFSQKNPETGVTEGLTLTTDKFGQVMVDTQRRFTGFIDTIRRDMVSFLQWGISAGIVYGSFQKLNEIVQIAISNQSKLADITIALGNTQRSTNEVFKEAAVVSQQMSEHLDGVLESYVLAYRATGAIKDEEQRFIATNKLLSDSLILSKLSGMEQAAAMDALGGALKQVQGPADSTAQALGRGTELLDKWVQTTRYANVDLETLASSFSITAESALGAGVKIEELNAIVALLSEKIGGLSPSETGNAVKAIIGGIYSDSAAKALSEFGIAVTDSEGRTREFLDVITQISELNKVGLISDDQINKLGYALGGGVRRGQQYISIIKDIGRVNELVAVQADSNGAAQAALAVKITTVESATTRLGNAFQILAQTAGSETGILSTFTSLLDISTQIVGVFTKITGALGTAGPVLLAVGAGALALRGAKGQSMINNVFGGGLGAAGQFVGGMFSGGVPNNPDYFNGKSSYPNKMGQAGYNAGVALSPWVMSSAAVGFTAVSNLQQGNTDRAAGNVAGGIIGALLTGGNPVGAVIGSAVAETFIKQVEDWKHYSPTAAEMFPSSDTGLNGAGKRAAKTEQEKLKEDLENAIFAEYGKQSIINSAIAADKANNWMFSNEAATRAEVEKAIARMTPAELIAAGKQKSGSGMAADKLLGIKDIPENQYLYAKSNITLTPEIQALDKAYSEYNPDNIVTDQNVGIRKSIQEQKELMKTALGGEFGGTSVGGTGAKLMSDALSEYATELRKRLLGQFTTGEINAKSYTEGVTKLPGSITAAATIFTAGGERFDKAMAGISGKEETLKALMEIMIEGSPEAATAISQLAGEVNNLKDKIEAAQKAGATKIDINGVATSVEDAQALQRQKEAELDAALQSNYVEMKRKQIKIPNVVDMTQIDKAYAATIEAGARQYQDNYYKSIGLNNAEIEAIVGQFPEFFGEFLNDFFVKVGAGLNPQLYQDYVKKMTNNGKLPTDVSAMGFNGYDAAKFRAAESAYPTLVKKLSESPLNYQAKETPQLVSLTDGEISVKSKDWKIMNFLMQQLVDINQKQLDGLYNLPTDASFYVPAQAAGMYPQGSAADYAAQIAKILENLHIGEVAPYLQPVSTPGFPGMNSLTFKGTPTPWTQQSAVSQFMSGHVPTTPAPEYSKMPDEAINEFLGGWKPPKYTTVPKSLLPGIINGLPYAGQSAVPNSSYAPPPTFPYATGPSMTPNGLYMPGQIPPSMSSSAPAPYWQLAAQNPYAGYTDVKSVNKMDFKFNLSSTTQLLVDGRAMANVVKKYLGEELIKFDNGSNSFSQTI